MDIKNQEIETGEAHLIPQLPDYKKRETKQIFTDRFASLNIPDEDKDRINIWWRTSPDISNQLLEFQGVTKSLLLPVNEMQEAKRVFESHLKQARDINQGILDIINHSPSQLQRFIGLYFSAFGTSKQEAAAQAIAQKIGEFNEDDKGEKAELTLAVCQAIIETRESNPDETIIRKKVAQMVFKEMFDTLQYSRLAYKADLDVEVSGMIDSPEEEGYEIKSALLGKPWTGEERKKMLRNYNKLRRVLDKLGSYQETKVGLNTLWKWANGTLPKDGSVFTVLEYADDLDLEITDDLKNAWDSELENEEDEEEPEDE